MPCGSECTVSSFKDGVLATSGLSTSVATGIGAGVVNLSIPSVIIHSLLSWVIRVHLYYLFKTKS
ncbi:hypothetical protein G293_02155 [Candidatus Liberibacter africanus PTSAPSY]|uniref:Uncharacterized protein n=1 Tax=Candidatus Liberibacter africanus PTSAPSY TaxID=1277257 RepID=A0A0G3I6E8_LIBAF|nr:hypothetical protein G293_02155 [Candidatus Liberibacter africanus PTSAPSY]